MPVTLDCTVGFLLSLGAPTPENAQKHSQNLSAVECLSVFDHSWGWRLKSYKELSKRCSDIYRSN